MEYLEGGKLPDDDKRARELTLSREQYLLLDGVLHFMAKDKTLRIIPPTGDRQQLFQEAHGDAFGGHLYTGGQNCWSAVKTVLVAGNEERH